MHDPSNESKAVAHCKHLRTKKMYIPAQYTQPGMLERSDTAVYWCICTARDTGPDGGLVHLDTCTPDRECCKGH